MFGVKSLASIQSSFTQAVSDLKSLIEANQEQVAKNMAEIQTLDAENNGLVVENAKADKFKQNLENLLA